MSNIVINNLTFGWDGSAENVFENVSARLDTDWKLGIIGRNGRGKTTLLKLLAGELPHSGSIIAPINFYYFPYKIIDSRASALDIIDAAFPNYEFWELCREMNLLGVPEEVLFRPFETLSPGERTKTLIASLFLDSGNFALLDEPTDHLDADGKRAVAEYLKSKKGFIIVSHDRALLDDVCDHIASIGKSGIEIISGNYSTFAEEKLRREQSERAENERLKKDITRLKTAARRTSDWSDKVEKSKKGNGPVDRGFVGHKSAKLMKRSKAIEARKEDAAEKKASLLNDVEQNREIKMTPLTHHSRTLAELKDIRVNYLTELPPFNLAVNQGERIALTGGNGAGKSTMLKLLANDTQISPINYTGAVTLASGIVISYVPQTSDEARGDLRQFAGNAGADLTLFLTILRNMGLEREAFDANLEDISDGMKRKALIARSLCIPAHLYIWDEPLNYIDILSREQIEDLILTYNPTMLFVEHDEMFLRRVATRAVRIA
jgi:lincosamide and streptogramin A transport system ATP-binding/permease protein